jgi:hypothetical protein
VGAAKSRRRIRTRNHLDTWEIPSLKIQHAGSVSRGVYASMRRDESIEPSVYKEVTPELFVSRHQDEIARSSQPHTMPKIVVCSFDEPRSD